MQIRLQKFLAQAGVASRRKAEQLILNGEITVNGEVVTELGNKVNAAKDVIIYNNKMVQILNKYVYIMLHKPEGFITTVKDQFNRPTVIDLILGVNERIFPIGRLDYDTSGLLLLTDDGDLTYKVTHPKSKIKKVYIAKVNGTVDKEAIKSLSDGIIIDGYKTAKAVVSIINSDKKYTSLKISIHEGKNRQVRKMCEYIGFRVVNLKRIAIGNLYLGDLKRGEYRELTCQEVNYLKNL